MSIFTVPSYTYTVTQKGVMDNGRYAGSWLWPSTCGISDHIVQLKCFCPLDFNKPGGIRLKRINSLRFQTFVMVFLLLDFRDENNDASHTLLNIIRQFYPFIFLLFRTKLFCFLALVGTLTLSLCMLGKLCTTDLYTQQEIIFQLEDAFLTMFMCLYLTVFIRIKSYYSGETN